MQNLYPLFERNRILKKELLWSLRDYSFAQARLEYEEYAEGMLRGCDVRVEGSRIVIGPGIIKYGTFICLMTEEESIQYEASDDLVVVKMRFYTEQVSMDYVLYKMELVADKDVSLKENEFEVCRYRLQEGAMLRDEHKDLRDMVTEYNTLNFIYATWGSLRERTLAPIVTRRFAKEILTAGGSEQADISFAYLCLGQTGAMAMDILQDYLTRKSHKAEKYQTNWEVFEEMCRIKEQLANTEKGRAQEKTVRKQIVVD